jgi:hypothetical protein
MTASGSPTSRKALGDGDVGCTYQQLAYVGFWTRRRLDLRVLSESIRYRGASGTFRKIAERFGLASVTASGAGAPREAEVLALQAGDWVEVKSADEIRATLDDRGMFRGLYFMDEMWRYCGRRFRVLKRMERLMVERSGAMRTIKNTVLLDGTVCDGQAHDGCDATCQHLWREIWLRRVDGPEGQSQNGANDSSTE